MKEDKKRWLAQKLGLLAKNARVLCNFSENKSANIKDQK